MAGGQLDDVGEIRSFQDLVVWQRSIELASAIYALTRAFPKDEAFGLPNQLRQTSVAIASKIAEGSGSGTAGGFLDLLRVANGSLRELQTQLIIARRLRLGALEHLNDCDDLLNQVSRMLSAMVRSLEPKNDSPGEELN